MCKSQWVPWYYVINNQVKTEAGAFIPAETIQTCSQMGSRVDEESLNQPT